MVQAAIIHADVKPKTSFEPHLVINQVVIPPAQEWMLPASGWCFLHMTEGAGYWLGSTLNHDLVSGSALVVSRRAGGMLRASQLSAAIVNYFLVQPERLTGLFTLDEQQLLHRAAGRDHSAARLFAPITPMAQSFSSLCSRSDRLRGFAGRLELLGLFALAFGEQLADQVTAGNPPSDAKARLMNLLNETPASELLELSFADLVEVTRCTPRHLSRVFHQVVGMSFRQKQAQLRLIRAQELLATTESKVVEVALESGYQSLSLFNLMFKRRFGTTPARWRYENRTTKRTKKPPKLPALLRA